LCQAGRSEELPDELIAISKYDYVRLLRERGKIVRSCCGDLVSIINAGNRKIAEHSARFLKVRFLPNTRNDTTKRNPTEKGRAVRATDSMDINQCLELGKIGRILYVDCEISMISIFIFPRLAEEKRTKNGVCNHAFCMMINSPLLQQYDFEKSLPQRLLFAGKS
jgi:hypothetical protein